MRRVRPGVYLGFGMFGHTDAQRAVECPFMLDGPVRPYRDPDVEWVVSQPVRLSWIEPTLGSHTPDLLTVGAGGQVTVWDARRLDEQDNDFKVHADVALRCCGSVGWCYAVFDEPTTIERLNLLWLHGFRWRPAWMHRHADLIRRTTGGTGILLGDLFTHDDGWGS